MKKIIIRIICSATLFTFLLPVLAYGNILPSIGASPRIIPHALSEDGQMVIDTNVTARDYASILLAQAWVAKNAPLEYKTRTTQELVKTIKDTEKLFINSDGSIKVEYSLADGAYKEVGTPEVRTQAYVGYALTYSHHAALGNINNFDWKVFNEVHKTTAYVPIKISAYSFNNLSDKNHGGFYKNLKKDKKELVDQAFGLFSIQPLIWLWEKHPDKLAASGLTIEELQNFAVQTDELLKKVWSEEYSIYADTFNRDGSNPNFKDPKYDLRTVGYLLWGHSMLHKLIEPIDPARAAAIETRARKFFNTVIVDHVTFKTAAGIPREISVSNGVVGVAEMKLIPAGCLTLSMLFFSISELSKIPEHSK